MRSFTKNAVFLLVVLAVISSSCKKDIAGNQTVPFMADNTALSANLFNYKGCPIAYTTDNSFIGAGDVNTIYFFYNRAGNPDSLNFAGTPIKLTYDRFKRLKKADFGTYAYFDFEYKGDFPLPVALEYFYPSFVGLAGGLVATDSFKYNRLGQITSVAQINPGNTAYNSVENYTYDWQGNVIKVDLAPYNGGTISGYTEFTATKYDNKPDFISANQWTKYLMFFTTYQSSPYLWTQLSRNNAKDFTWTLDPFGDVLSVISTFVYDRQGFANTINEEFYDNVGDTLNYTRTSLSACDAAVLNPPTLASVNSSFIKNMHRKAPSPVPSVIQ